MADNDVEFNLNIIKNLTDKYEKSYNTEMKINVNRPVNNLR